MNKGLKIQAQLKEKENTFESEIKSLEASIASCKQKMTTLSLDYHSDVDKIRQDEDYCNQNRMNLLTCQLEEATSVMEKMRLAAIKDNQ